MWWKCWLDCSRRFETRELDVRISASTRPWVYQEGSGIIISRTGTRFPGLDSVRPVRRVGSCAVQPDPMKATLEVINRMQADGIIGKYAIGGAVGATFYLEPSATADIDIFVMLPTAPGSSLLSISPIYEYLRARACRIEGERIVVGDWPVQFLPPRGALEEEALANAVETEVAGVRTWVLSAEHLVGIALQTGRTKDYARIVQFLEQDAVNADKLTGVFARHGLVPQWEKFKRKYLEK